jgi:nucleotide-binding universal stress UspA family protein
MANVPKKLSGSIEGALAGGGDPASSPLYVFGPFIRLLVASSLVAVSFGAALWLAVLTVVTVSAMYRLVMRWVTDGSGGSGLNEEEFGRWAVVMNAGITVIEYTLTFLVSVAALVEFLADRFPALQESLFGVPVKTLVAVVATLGVGFAVNLGPKVSARTFGPATGAVLLLLWTMIIATVVRFGIRLPHLRWAAFARGNINVTLGGYARILALMTGIEVFANLVAAYDGPAKVRSRKAFGSLMIVMGTTSLTMLIVGPAILELSDSSNLSVSVFTQTMDKLLPEPLPYVGTLIGVAVLLSAAAAAAQGIQNLCLGLRYRHYIPAWLGQRNRHAVASSPAWIQVAFCCACFVVLGTREDTYLALYAIGVFVLLSMTGWAAVKRLLRENRRASTAVGIASLVGAACAALLTSGATVVIIDERFRQGAWLYFVLVPMFCAMLIWFRRRLGAPDQVEERLGQMMSASTLAPAFGDALYAGVSYEEILVPLDRTPVSELSLAQAQTMARHYTGTIKLLTVVPEAATSSGQDGETELYLQDVADDLASAGYSSEPMVRAGAPATTIGELAAKSGVDLVILSTHGRSRVSRWVASSVTLGVIHQTTAPLLVIRPTEDWRSTRTRFQHLLVALDGSPTSEEILPHVHELASKFSSEVTVLSAVEGSESDDYPKTAASYLQQVCEALGKKGVAAKPLLVQGAPDHAILEAARTERADLIMLVTHGRGGVERQATVKLGSVADKLLQETPCPIFLVSAGADLHVKAARTAAGETEAAPNA